MTTVKVDLSEKPTMERALDNNVFINHQPKQLQDKIDKLINETKWPGHCK